MTLEINQKCNLRCRYCYLGEKDGAMMSLQTGLDSIDLAFEKVRLHKDRKLWFDFVGGESFIDFKYIQVLVDYIEKKNLKLGYNILYSVTTNGTIFNKEIVDYLVKFNFSLKISLDGKKEINDRNRISPSGYSVHDKIIDNLYWIKEYEKRTGKMVQVSNVVTHNNYTNLYETLVYLTKDLNFRIVDTAIDCETKWQEYEIDSITVQIEKCVKYFFECYEQGHIFVWNYILKLGNVNKRHERFYRCGAGIVSSYVRTDGNIFACVGNLKPEMAIGTVEKGIDERKYSFLKNLQSIENSKCKKCDLDGKCAAQSCIMQSISKTGDYQIPDATMCKIERFLVKLYEANKNKIDALNIEG